MWLPNMDTWTDKLIRTLGWTESEIETAEVELRGQVGMLQSSVIEELQRELVEIGIEVPPLQERAVPGV